MIDPTVWPLIIGSILIGWFLAWVAGAFKCRKDWEE